MADLREGTLLGERFEIVGVLGRGGMATVYLAQDRLRGERVALKLLHAHLADQPSVQARLRREIQAASRLRHPAALVAWELHELEGAMALSMPFHRGQTLGERVAGAGPLAPDALRALGARLAGALAEAHAQGVLHGDISPANVMVGGEGAALSDFGLARFQDRHTRRSTGVLGSPGYTAPEVYEGSRADPRSDLYSLGATLYFAATGRDPFSAHNPVGVLQRQLEERFEPLSAVRPELPADLRATIEALLARDPAARPESARALAEALEARVALEAPRLPEAAATAVPAVRSHLPQGEWLVSISGQPPEVRAQAHRRRHQRRRQRRRDPRPTGLGAVDQVLEQVGRGLEKVAEGIEAGLEAISTPTTPAEQLTEEVARIAGLPRGALRVPPTLSEKRLRLVDRVGEAEAEALAAAARALGFKASAERHSRLHPDLQAIARHAPVLIPVLWVCFPFAVASGFNPLVLLPLFISLTILLPVLSGVLGGPEARKWPLAFGADLRPLLEDRDRALLPPVALGLEEAEAPAGAPPAPAEVAGAPPETRGEALARRSTLQLDALEALIAERAHALPAPAVADLRANSRRLRQQAAALGEGAASIERELSGMDAGAADAELAWMEDRLRRLETLERAGEAVDGAERARLRGALEAHRASMDATAALERQLTATLARLLEISTTAGRVRRELAAGAGVEAAEAAEASAAALAEASRLANQAAREAAGARPDDARARAARALQARLKR